MHFPGTVNLREGSLTAPRKILLRLLRDKSSATEPHNVNLSEYSSISSSECDYTTEPEEQTANTDTFLFHNVKKTIRRRLRKKPIKSSIFTTKTGGGGEDSKPVEEFSSSSSSSESEDLAFAVSVKPFNVTCFVIFCSL